MSPQVVVLNRHNANSYSFKNHDQSSIVISITDVDKPYNLIRCNHENGIKAILHLKFDDVEKGGCNCIMQQDADNIVDFVNTWKDKVDTIIVHCEAGISRSAGVAAAILKYIYNNDEPIFSSPRFCPNMTCYRLVLETFHNRNLERKIKSTTYDIER